jgi:hypothetical protein
MSQTHATPRGDAAPMDGILANRLIQRLTATLGVPGSLALALWRFAASMPEGRSAHAPRRDPARGHPRMVGGCCHPSGRLIKAAVAREMFRALGF